MAASPQTPPQTPPPITPPRRVLPKGRNAASREVVWDSQHARLLEAMATVVAERGYGATTVADVIAAAGVSRKTFYEHFANREECFLAAYDAGVDLLLAAIDRAVTDAAPDWQEAMRAGAAMFLSTMAENPGFARTFLIDVFAAGAPALERRRAVHRRFAEQLAVGHAAARRDLPDLPALPDYVFRACVGAINELLVEHVASEGPETLPTLTDQLVEIELSLYAGYDVLEVVRERTSRSPARSR